MGQIVENLQAQPELPTPQNVTVRSPRPRDYLTEREVEKLMDAARENRWGHRDATAILLAYRHGLRASELVALRWDDINLQAGKLHVRLQRETPEGQRSVHVFVSERLAPLSVSGYQRMVARAGEAAKFPFLISSHVLRHSCGYKLANDGQDTRAIQHYLGHRRSPRPCATRSWCRIVSRDFGKTEAPPVVVAPQEKGPPS
jgi:integrase